MRLRLLVLIEPMRFTPSPGGRGLGRGFNHYPPDQSVTLLIVETG